jgi:hypothetical protein
MTKGVGEGVGVNVGGMVVGVAVAVGDSAETATVLCTVVGDNCGVNDCVVSAGWQAAKTRTIRIQDK